MLKLQESRLCLAASVALWVLFVTVSSPASAQLTDRQWELGFAVGSANLSSSGEDFDLDVRFDVRAGYLFSDRFELEAQLFAASAPLDAGLNAWMINGLYNFQPEKKTVPYLLVGVGSAEIDDVSLFGLGPDLSESSTAYQLGFGSRFFVGQKRRMAWRLELSSLWMDTDLFDSDRHISLMAGLSWALGNRS